MALALISANRWVILANSPEHLAADFLSQKPLIAVFKNSALYKFVLANFPAQQIIPLKYFGKNEELLPWSLDVSKLIKKSDLTEQLVKRGVKYFFVPYRSSAFLEGWAKKNNLVLLVTPYSLQNKLEDKSYFDKLLKKQHIASPRTFNALNLSGLPNQTTGYVLQQAKVSDYFKTTFLKNNQELLAFAVANRAKLNQLVLREFLPGLPLGVSIFLDRYGNYFYSALRRQCFIFDRSFPKDFIGLQWLASSALAGPVKARLKKELAKLTRALIKEGFTGVANVDFLIYRDKIYVLECNPRLSVAMPQIFLRNDLTRFERPFDFLLNTFVSGREYVKIKQPNLPGSNFSGSVLELAALRRFTVKQPALIGVYAYHQGQIKFLGQHKKLLAGQPNRFFLFHELTSGMVLKRGYALASIFANFALFNSESGELNNTGLILSQHFNRVFTKNYEKS